jgi:Zn-dependent protease with chaperone function
MRHSRIFLFGVAIIVLGITVLAEQKTVLRRSSLRKGPGGYYEVVTSVKKGDSVDVGETEKRWVSAEAGDSNGWLPSIVFEKPRSSVDYSGLLASDDAVVMSSIDIAAGTKGAFLTAYAKKHNINLKSVAKLANKHVKPMLVRELKSGAKGAIGRAIVSRLPKRKFENEVVIQPDVEELLGKALAARLLTDDLIEDIAVNEYVNGVAAVVGEKSERYDLNYRVGIMDSKEVNGFGLPGGYILMTKGLLDSFSDEAELACFLGHEMAHVSLYHGLREFQKRDVHRRRDAAFAELDEETGDRQDVEDDLDQTADTAYLKIIGKRSRNDELEADLYGAAYAAAAGYDPQAAVDALERLDALNLAGDPFKHHPSIGERVTHLESGISKYRLVSKGLRRLKDRFRDRVKSLKKGK